MKKKDILSYSFLVNFSHFFLFCENYGIPVISTLWTLIFPKVFLNDIKYIESVSIIV